MSKKGIYLGLAMMIAACGSPELFMEGLPPEEPKKKQLKPMTPEREKEIMERIEKNLHDFNIHGTIIRARNRKTAIKIYNNRKYRKSNN